MRRRWVIPFGLGLLLAGFLARAFIGGYRCPWVTGVGATLVFGAAILVAGFVRARRSGADELFDLTPERTDD